MGLISKFEGRMEDTFEGAMDNLSNSPISPVQIAKKAEKQMRREKMVGAGKQYAPTLYTVLVNPEDDQRMFGYYPTLAGETETYLAAKAAEQGLVMDGQPLVRFIVDDGLKHGKFEVIAEAVAAPIVVQLRQEEMERYGLASRQYGAAQQQPAQQPAPRPTPSPAPAQQAYGAAQQPATYASPAYNNGAAAYGAAPAYPAQAGYSQQVGYGAYIDYDALGDAPVASPDAPKAKPPLPYVPEDELDYSIDYGEYTFNSYEFDDGSGNDAVQQPAAAAPAAKPAYAPAQPAYAQPAYAQPATAAQQAPAAQPAYAQQPAANPMMPPQTMVLGAQQPAPAAPAQPQPNERQVIPARLVDTATNRSYSLVVPRVSIGRESKNNIAIADLNISRTHAELRYDQRGFWIINDMGSTNGTFVNDREVRTYALSEGDVITLGATNLYFTLR